MHFILSECVKMSDVINLPPTADSPFWSIASWPSALLPSSPENLKIKTIIQSVASSSAPVAQLMYTLAAPMGQILALSAVIKIWKLIPFKMS